MDQALHDFARPHAVQVDAPIVLAAGATRLLTEDLQDEQLVDGVLRVENPFR